MIALNQLVSKDNERGLVFFANLPIFKKGHGTGSKKYFLARNQKCLKQNWLLEYYLVY